MSTVIKIENLSKQYRLGTVGTGSLAHDLNRAWHRLRGKADPYLKIGEENNRSVRGKSDYVWALKDINFDVKHGEVMGIIGRNGAGKSTLLKILSRTTSPTTGSIKIKGRVASLLEVGTGFHPELSGRENIFLNGAILGMTKNEIKKKFDEIVDFAGVERYIDTPVKRYSSGMYVRLAFGVAAHLEPEILIVDEVLAVGDAEFQKKALGKMQDVSSREGRTVLFVSHNMAAIQNLCTKVIVLEAAKKNYHGITENGIRTYLKLASHLNTASVRERKDRTGNQKFTFTHFEFRNKWGELVSFLQSGEDFTLNLFFKTQSNFRDLIVALGINDESGNRILHLNNEMTGQVFSQPAATDGVIEIALNKLPLQQGQYSVTLFSKANGEITDWLQEAFCFDVEQGDFFRTGKIVPQQQGAFLMDHSFSLKQ